MTNPQNGVEEKYWLNNHLTIRYTGGKQNPLQFETNTAKLVIYYTFSRDVQNIAKMESGGISYRVDLKPDPLRLTETR